MTLTRLPDQPEHVGALLRVVLAAGDARFRVVARALLAQHAEVVVVGEAATAVEALDTVSLLHPDLVLLDLELPGEPMPSLVGALRRLPASPRVVLLAWDDDDEYRQAAARAGACLCVSKRRLDQLFSELDRACA